MSLSSFIEACFTPISLKEEPHFMRRVKQHALRTLENEGQQRLLDHLSNQHFEAPFSSMKRVEKELVLPRHEDSFILFENGTPRLDISSTSALKRATILPFYQAARSYGPLLESSTFELMHREKDPFFFLQLATSQEGLFVYLPPKSEERYTLQIIHLITSQEKPFWMAPRLHILLGAETELDLIETYAGASSSPFFLNSFTSFDLAVSSKVSYTRLSTLQGNRQRGHVKASLKQGALFRSTTLFSSSETLSQKVRLTERQAMTELQGASLAHHTDQPSLHIEVDHEAAHTSSNQVFKAIVKDDARLSFSSRVTLHKEADKAKATTSHHTILMGRHARVESKPEMKIHADDVEARHGATVGKIEEEELLYMRMRGLPEEEAKALLLQGFIKETVGHMTDPMLQKSSLYPFLKETS